MYGTVKLGEKDVPMMANAATPIRYKQVFGKNLLKYFMGEASPEDMAAMVSDLAYIMTKAAAGADMNKLNIDEYIDWLDEFGAMDFVEQENVEAIMAIYKGNDRVASKAKKNQGRLKEK